MDNFVDDSGLLSLPELSRELSISVATGKNWIKLNKITPTFYDGDTPFFSRDYASKIKLSLTDGNNSALKMRRNKKYISGRGIYNSYTSPDCKGALKVKKIIDLTENEDLVINDDTIPLMIAQSSLNMLAGRYMGLSSASLFDFINGDFSLGKYDELIMDILGKKSITDKAFLEKTKELTDFEYECGEDVLGLLYISLKGMGNRKAGGIYYTPSDVVKRLIDGLFKGESPKKDIRILDPCCGTGNFLIQLPGDIGFESIYGNDIDKMSVMIARINMALRFPDADADEIKRHIRVKNFILDDESDCKEDFSYDIILGNPPWGYDFDDDERAALKKRYASAQGKNMESYDIFLEKAVFSSPFSPDRRVAFVLPEAILGVRVHTPIRKIILENTQINRIEYLGDVFDSVQCPSIIMELTCTGKKLMTRGICIKDKEREYTINTDRSVDPEYFGFGMDDDEYLIMEKMLGLKNAAFLKDNADFALGIVTGNNNEFISDVRTDKNEVILRGSDISRYCINESGSYIEYIPERFQQVAKDEVYRSKEKILYKFISSRPSFAYDDKGRLSLNSCNILIPNIPGLKMKYVLSVLNSTAAYFFFKKNYNSVKVLRSHIESIPIPYADDRTQDKIIALADKLTDPNLSDRSRADIDNAIDDHIFLLYGLNDKEIVTVCSSLHVKDVGVKRYFAPN